MTDVKALIATQRQLFRTGITLSRGFRLKQLNQLRSAIITNEGLIAEALAKDLGKHEMESQLAEIMMAVSDVEYAIKHLSSWMKPKRVGSPFPAAFPGCSKIYSEPYGEVLIMAPWNYPFLLVIAPLIGAIAAGNCVIIKPSEIATHMEQAIVKVISDAFDSSYVAAVTGGAEVAKALLQEEFDYIFYTGGPSVAKHVMAAAANYLTPVTLELGGKSPCLIDETADIAYAARRVVWAKWMNAGQTCIAPDYVVIHESKKAEWIKACQLVLKSFYGVDPEKSDSYGRIINDKQYVRLMAMMQSGKILTGGRANASTRYIEPTLIEPNDLNVLCMQDEIFGPILPVVTYTNLSEWVASQKNQAKPLACYVFTKSSQAEQMIIDQLSFGGGCVNDCLMQIYNPNLPFGGVGQSGMGAYRGRYSFDTFSHHKGVYKRLWPLDFSIQYPPYTESKFRWVKRLLRFSL